jgi:hypothetical protein
VVERLAVNSAKWRMGNANEEQEFPEMISKICVKNLVGTE